MSYEFLKQQSNYKCPASHKAGLGAKDGIDQRNSKTKTN